jgi:hypothetical protein
MFCAQFCQRTFRRAGGGVTGVVTHAAAARIAGDVEIVIALKVELLLRVAVIVSLGKSAVAVSRIRPGAAARARSVIFALRPSKMTWLGMIRRPSPGFNRIDKSTRVPLLGVTTKGDNSPDKTATKISTWSPIATRVAALESETESAMFILLVLTGRMRPGNKLAQAPVLVHRPNFPVHTPHRSSRRTLPSLHPATPVAVHPCDSLTCFACVSGEIESQHKRGQGGENVVSFPRRSQ